LIVTVIDGNVSRQLDAGVEASGPHDFAVRCMRRSSPTLPASTASRPAFVTIAKRPSGGRDDGAYSFDLGKRRSGIFLKKGLDSRIDNPPVGQITEWDRSMCGPRSPPELGGVVDAAFQLVGIPESDF
jgi:hypothetical protein